MSKAPAAHNLGEANTAGVRLVQEALRAELNGDTERRVALLENAMNRFPDSASVRWHTGYVRSHDGWTHIDQIAERNAVDEPQLAEYRRLRDARSETAGDHLALARWCRKNKLDAEARAHWLQFVRWQPHNSEALKALGAQWYHGMLLTHDQVKEVKRARNEAHRQFRYWRPQIARWRRAIEGSDSYKRDEALAELRALNDPMAIPAIEDGLSVKRKSSKGGLELSLEVVDWLAGVKGQEAVGSLVRHAVFSSWPEVRAASSDQLGLRPLYSYAPMLLAGMTSPIESTRRIGVLPNGSITYFHRLYREGPLADDSNVVNSVYESPVRASRVTVQGIATRLGRARDRAAEIERVLAKQNARARWLNGRIQYVLTRTTGVQLDPVARLWWDWWADYNELHYPAKKPVRERISTVAMTVGAYECLGRDTTLWTLTGPAPIESIRIGDRILAQDPSTGELDFKAVLSTSVRPPSPMLTIRMGSHTVRTTRGHPFWVVGRGWIMAKHVEPGDRIHAMHHAVVVDSVDKASDDAAYNVVVADFNSYFAGDTGVLVHDSTARAVTSGLLPGLLVE